MDPADPAALQLVAENYGLPGMVLFALVALLGFLSLGLPRLITAIRGAPGAKHKATNTPTPAPGKATLNWLSDMRASQVKGKADETQDDRLDRVEGRLDQLEARINECFTVEGKHRTELLAAIADVRSDLKHTTRKVDGCATSIATLQGMVAGNRRGSGVTGMFNDKDKG